MDSARRTLYNASLNGLTERSIMEALISQLNEMKDTIENLTVRL
jgi:hypothetical protein